MNRKYKYTELEILYPQNWNLASKEFVKKWFSSLGYVKMEPKDFGKMYPEQCDRLLIIQKTTECTAIDSEAI